MKPALGGPDVGEVRHPFLVGRTSLEPAVQHITCNYTSLSVVLGQAPASGPPPKRLLAHESLDAGQPAWLIRCQDVVLDPSGAIRAVAAQHCVIGLLSLRRLPSHA